MTEKSQLPDGPFTRETAHEAGITDRMLQGRRFVRIYPPRVATGRLRDDARRLADRRGSGPTRHGPPHRHQQAAGPRPGLRAPAARPFVVQGPLHLSFDNVFLHRTKKLPPRDAVGVTVEAAYLSYCSIARVIDAIKVGDWLLHRQHLDLEALTKLAAAELWRPGSHEVLWIVDHLNGRSKSLKESELRAVLEFAGLPAPEVNVNLDVGPDAVVEGDLWYPAFKTLVEYEGMQHQTDRAQYRRDLERFGLVRDREIRYVQVTHEHLATPRIAVGRAFRALKRAGYDGPPPVFADRWRLLFAPVSVAIGPRVWPRTA